MDGQLYDSIYKRKSFHIFRNNQGISTAELQEIEARMATFTPLENGVKTAIQILPPSQTSCKRGQEYCICFYSNK